VSKTCFKCSKVKPLAEFYRHAMMADGHLNKCIECTKADVLKHRAENVDRIREYDRERAKRPESVAARVRVFKRYLEMFPERRSANIAVANAIRDGRLKPQLCWVCGEKAVAHHPDYSSPLDVVWLCQIHHKEAHALINKQGELL